MPRTHDVAAIRAVLERDRAWCAYAIGDLSAEEFPHCAWYVAGQSLALLYEAFSTPVLFATPDAPPELLREAVRPEVYLQVRHSTLDRLREIYRHVEVWDMWRMQFRGDAPAGPSEAVPVDAEETAALYAAGDAAERPDFFAPVMVERGVFRGIRRGGDLVAVAGTHLVTPGERVAAIGNVFTRRDWRGRGLATLAVGAVLRELAARNVATIILNVTARNAAAIRVYERLGFVRHCPYVEGVARHPVF